MRDRCDYGEMADAFPWVFARGQRLIISPDLDGVTSTLLMNEVLGCAVEGVYTLDALWTNPGLIRGDPEDALSAWDGMFLDHDINRRTIRSLGHHLLQWSHDTPIPEHTQGNASLNPNLLRGITKRNSLQRKYPFGTVHLLLALFQECAGLAYDPSEMMTTFLMHVDSSFVNAMNYQQNALDWLEWLGGSGRASPLYPICRRMLKLNPRALLSAFKDLGDQLEGLGLTRRSQGPVRNPNDSKDVAQLTSIVSWLVEQTGWSNPFDSLKLGELTKTPMVRRSGKSRKRDFVPMIESRPFSYAILGGGPQSLNYNWLPGREPRE